MTTRFAFLRLFFALLLGTVSISLTGCGALVVGGTAATTAKVATDRRTAGEQVEDQAIELKTAAEMRVLFDDTARVNAMAYAGHVLLTGDVPNDKAKQQAEEAAQQVEKVQKVHNQLRVGDKTPISVRSQDTWITSKVRSSLINTKEVPTRTMKITTERGVVYLMGRVTEDEAKRSTIVASSISGVNKVVRAFEIITEEDLQSGRYSSSESSTEDNAKSSNAASDEDDSGVESIPLEI